MKVAELIAELRNADPNDEVKVAVQPGYPMRADFEGVVMHGSDVWLVVGEHDGYDVPSGIHGQARRGW
jgi:hypothetical protein